MFQTRLLMLFAICSTLVLVFCCVPLVVLQYAFGPKITESPAEVEAVAKKIAPLAIPANFAGIIARSAENSLLQVNVARFDQNDGRGRMIIGQVHMTTLPLSNDYDAKLLKNLVDEMYPTLRMIDASQTRESIHMIHGQKVTFEIIEGEDRSTTTRLKQVTGAYNGPQGAVRLLLQAESEFLSDQAIEDLLQSMADPPLAAPAAP